MKLIELILNSQITDDEALRLLNFLKQEEQYCVDLKKYSKFAFEKILERINKSADKKKLNKKRKNNYTEDFLRDLKIVGRHDTRHSSAFRNLQLFLAKDGMIGKVYRDFYVFLVLQYIGETEKYRNLFGELDLEEKEKGSNYPTEEIFKQILDARVSYNLTIEDIKTLYNILHFERLTEEQEEIMFSDASDSDVLIQKNEELANSQKVLERKIVELEEELKRTPAQEIVKEYDDRELKDEIRAIKKSFEGQIKDLYKNLEQISENFSGKAKEEGQKGNFKKILQNTEVKFDKKVKDLQKEHNSQVTRISKDLKSDLEEKVGEVRRLVNTSLAEMNEKISLLFKAEKKDLMGASVEAENIQTLDVKRQDIKQEAIFVHAWLKHLSDAYGIYLTLDQAVLIHCVFKTLNFVSVENVSICRSWLETLGLEGLVKLESASPLWINQLDWYGLYSHLSLGEGKLKVGILSNYDTAITESYLKPALQRWSISGSSLMKKLFLIQSTDSDDKLAQNEILSLVSELKYEDYPEIALKVDLSGEDKFPFDKAMPRIKESTLESWTKFDNGQSLKRIVVEIPKERDGILISEYQLSVFSSLLKNLADYFERVNCINIAHEIVLRRYVEVKYGVDLSIKYRNFIVEMLEYES